MRENPWLQLQTTQRVLFVSAMPRWRPDFAAQANVAMGHVWTAPGWQVESSRCSIGSEQPCVRPLDAVHMTAGIMPSADQVPVKSTHSTMLWPKWVVLIAGSTGAALRAVRPPNRYVTPDIQRDSSTLRVRRAPYSSHPWPSWPTPCVQSCWRAQSQQLWSVDGPAVP